MKIPLSWVKEFTRIRIDITPQNLCELLSAKLSEVETLKTSKSNDKIIEIENKALTHRGDCFSIEGIAREISAITNSSFKLPDYKTGNIPIVKDIQIHIENPKDCPRYIAVKIRNLKVESSPKEIQTRLLDCGIRPINNIVDFTNYAMLETGQPLHAFDASKLGKKEKYRLGVRRGKKGEVLTTLDGVRRPLSENNVVITNNNKPIAIAGIMGGKDTEVDEKTTEIILEAANFNNFVTRESSRKLNLRTEASGRFEKNISPDIAERGLGKFLSLLNKYESGKVAGLSEKYVQTPLPRTIELTLDFINKTLGTNLNEKEATNILALLGFTIKKEGPTLTVSIPFFRRDVSIKEDLLEEIARIYGYEKIAPKLPSKEISPTMLDFKLEFIRQIKALATVLGYSEVYNYSFVGEELYQKVNLRIENLIELINPISPQLKFMRNNLLPNMYEKVELNKKNFSQFKLFEVGKELHKKARGLPEEIYTLCAAYYDANQPDYETLYRKAKGDMEILLSNFINLEGDINPIFSAQHLIIYKINLENLYEKHIKYKKEIKDVSSYPPIIEDFSFYVKKESRVGDIIKKIRNINTLIRDIELKDIYKEKDNKSITLTVVYQSPQRPLSDKDVAPIRKQIIKLLEEGLGLTVRK